MQLEDVQINMTVRVGPTPGTTADPYIEGTSPGNHFVAPVAAGRLGRVHELSPGDDTIWTGAVLVYSLSEDTLGEEFCQWIHVAHLTAWTAEPAVTPEHEDNLFDAIIGGTELDSLRDLGDQLDTAKVKDDEHGDPQGLAPEVVTLDLPTREVPVPGEFSIYPPQEGDHSGYIDPDGDEMGIFFRESNCATHGYEAAFTLHVNGQAVIMTPSTALQLAHYIAQRAQRIRDRGEDLA